MNITELKAITDAECVKNVAKNMMMQRMNGKGKRHLVVIADGVKNVVINCTLTELCIISLRKNKRKPRTKQTLINRKTFKYGTK